VTGSFASVGCTVLFMYIYDDWRYLVEVIGFGQKVARTRYPKVHKQVGDPNG
jgi:hypothetical protein